MSFASPFQNFQDWLTQQWVIITGKKFDDVRNSWLIGPFGKPKKSGFEFINDLADRENLVIDRGEVKKGLIPSINQLGLSQKKLKNLDLHVRDFYENTRDYDLGFEVRWNPVFKIFGKLLQLLFSNRLKQLNIPVRNQNKDELLNNEIINLIDPKKNQVKYTFWLRSFKSTGQILFFGIYEICTMPSGKKSIKAIFPLPQGNATVFLEPEIGENGALILSSSGNSFGDAGFYFLLRDSNKKYWAKHLPSFKDQLSVSRSKDGVFARQKMTLWNLNNLEFIYEIKKVKS